MGLIKNKKSGFKLYELTETEIYKIMPKLKKRNFGEIRDKDKRIYYLRCWLVTEMQPLHKLPNFSKRCWNKSSCYELDHILSISTGFYEKIPPHLIGSMDNLRFIPLKENRDKSFKLIEDSHKLLRKFKRNENIYKKKK